MEILRQLPCRWEAGVAREVEADQKSEADNRGDRQYTACDKVIFKQTALALLVNHVDPEREHILAASAGHMMKTSALKEMHVVITKVLLLLLLIVIVDQVS